MTYLRSWLCALFFLLVSFSLPAFAQRNVFELDPSRSSVHFTLKTSLHTVHGTFRLKSGKVSVDPLTGGASGSIVVDAVSGDTGNSGRDSKMHGEILRSRIYPEIAFVPRDIQGHIQAEGDSQLEISGAFHLLGLDHEIAVPAIVRIAGSALSLDSDFSIPYIAWGLKNPSTFILRASDMVQLSLHAVGSWTPESAN